MNTTESSPPPASEFGPQGETTNNNRKPNGGAAKRKGRRPKPKNAEQTDEGLEQRESRERKQDQRGRNNPNKKYSETHKRGTGYPLDSNGVRKGPPGRKPRGKNTKKNGHRAPRVHGPPPAKMTMIVHRIKLIDGWFLRESAFIERPAVSSNEDGSSEAPNQNDVNIGSYYYEEPDEKSPPHTDVATCDNGGGDHSSNDINGNYELEAAFSSNQNGNGRTGDNRKLFALVYAPQSNEHGRKNSAIAKLDDEVEDKANPFSKEDENFVHDKYWAQRKRFFSRFDEGIKLDPQGWYSVTPEAIADHVARRVGEAASNMLMDGPVSDDLGITVLDAFCGCGGNSIAFGKLSPFSVSKIISCDIDIVKLRYAAHNAAIYGIPSDKIVFILCNSLYVMNQCYKDGTLVDSAVSDGLAHNAVVQEEYNGFKIGGLELLPERIHGVFMDPPWGGVDYNRHGMGGYDLSKHIQLPYDYTNRIPDNNSENTSDNDAGATIVNGETLLLMAARATRSKFVVYDIPRNTKKKSIAVAALSAGYHGNMKVEEYFLNGRLKTTTAYMGWDYSLDDNLPAF